MARTIERDTTDSGTPVPTRGTYAIAANTLVFKGEQVGLDADGRAMRAGPLSTGCVLVVGKASHTVDNRNGSELGGAAGAADLEVEFGAFGWNNSESADEIAADDVGKVCYAVDEETVALTSQSSTLPPAGFVTEVRDGQVFVAQSPAFAKSAEAAALADAGVALQKRTVTVGHADLTDADTSEDESIGAALPANARVLGTTIKLATPFSGITGPITVDIGSSGDIDALVDGAKDRKSVV